MVSQHGQHGLQQVIGAALIDRDVLTTLLRDPLALAERFELTMPERRFMARVRARDLEEFATLVENWTDHGPVVPHRATRATAGRSNDVPLAG